MLDIKEIWCNGQFVEVSKEVYEVYKQGKRKHRYFTVDLKIEHIKVDQEKQSVTVTPSREDSLDTPQIIYVVYILYFTLISFFV